MSAGIKVDVCIEPRCNRPTDGGLCCREHMAEAAYGSFGQG